MSDPSGIYVACRGAMLHGNGWVRKVAAGERINASSSRDTWLLAAAPPLWRRQGADGWLRCTRPFVVHSTTPPIGCRLGETLHAGDPRVAWGGRDRFERVPRDQWPPDN